MWASQTFRQNVPFPHFFVFQMQHIKYISVFSFLSHAMIAEHMHKQNLLDSLPYTRASVLGPILEKK